MTYWNAQVWFESVADRPENRPLIQINHVHSSVSYQQATYQKYDRHGHKSPSGYGPLGTLSRKVVFVVTMRLLLAEWVTKYTKFPFDIKCFDVYLDGGVDPERGVEEYVVKEVFEQRPSVR